MPGGITTGGGRFNAERQSTIDEVRQLIDKARSNSELLSEMLVNSAGASDDFEAELIKDLASEVNGCLGVTRDGWMPGCLDALTCWREPCEMFGLAFLTDIHCRCSLEGILIMEVFTPSSPHMSASFPNFASPSAHRPSMRPHRLYPSPESTRHAYFSRLTPPRSESCARSSTPTWAFTPPPHLPHTSFTPPRSESCARSSTPTWARSAPWRAPTPRRWSCRPSALSTSSTRSWRCRGWVRSRGRTLRGGGGHNGAIRYNQWHDRRFPR